MLGTQQLLDAALRNDLKRFVHVSHRRGLRLHRRGLLGRGPPARAELPLLGVEGRQRPARPQLPPHARPERLDHALHATTTGRTTSPRRSSRSSSRTSSTTSTSRSTARATTSATGCTSTTTPAASPWCWSAAAPARSTTSAAAPSSPTKSSPSMLLEATGKDWSYVDRVAGPPRPRPPLLGRHLQDPLRARLRAAGALRAGPRRRRAVVPRQPRSGGSPSRSARPSHERATTAASTSSPAPAACSAPTSSRPLSAAT